MLLEHYIHKLRGLSDATSILSYFASFPVDTVPI